MFKHKDYLHVEPAEFSADWLIHPLWKLLSHHGYIILKPGELKKKKIAFQK